MAKTPPRTLSTQFAPLSDFVATLNVMFADLYKSAHDHLVAYTVPESKDGYIGEIRTVSASDGTQSMYAKFREGWKQFKSATDVVGATVAGLTPNVAVATDATAALASSVTTSTELGYVHGVTSDIQTQLNGKQATIGYTPENTANKETGSAPTDDTAKYPSSHTVFTALGGKVDANVAVAGATHTKITYDAKGLVVSGADATTTDIADSTNKRYVTDAELTVIGNTSGTNTGDETQSTIKTKLGAASAGADGYLTAADWLTFNSKEPALTKGNLTAGSSKIAIGGTGTGAVIGTGVSVDLGSVNLDDLADAAITSPAVDQILKYNGSAWVNGNPLPASAGNGVEFFMNNAAIIAPSTNNAIEVNSLTRAPSGATEDIVSVVCNNNTVIAEAHLYNTALGRTSLDAGIWDFDTWCGVSSAAGTSQLLINMMRVRPVTPDTVTTTGTGTSRTATASAGTHFATAEIDASATIDAASYLQTPQGLYQITARTSDTVVTIATPSTYANESAVAFSVWKKLFQITTGAINAISPAYTLINTQTVQPAFTVVATDKLGQLDIGTTTRNTDTTITHVQDGTARYSHVATPLATLHDDLAGLQGGSAGQYYHLDATKYSYMDATSSIQTQLNGKQAAGTYVTSVGGTSPVVSSGGTTPAISMAAATDSVNGYLTSTDHATFNGKADAADSLFVPSPYTWTNSTANTFLVSGYGDVTNSFPLGLPIRCTQGTERNAVVVNATYSNPNVSVTVDSNVLDASVAITNPKTVSLSIPTTGGWVADANTWVYASASTFTITGDFGKIFIPGTRLRWTQTTTKYGIVGVSSVSNGTTTVTILVNTDYVLTNAAIGGNCYSRELNPQEMPTWFAYTPTYTGWSSNPSGQPCYYSIQGATCFLSWGIPSISNGTSNSTAASMTGPVKALHDVTANVRGYNNGAGTSAAVIRTAPSSATIALYPDSTFGNWTASTTKSVSGNFFYPIASTWV